MVSVSLGSVPFFSNETGVKQHKRFLSDPVQLFFAERYLPLGSGHIKYNALSAAVFQREFFVHHIEMCPQMTGEYHLLILLRILSKLRRHTERQVNQHAGSFLQPAFLHLQQSSAIHHLHPVRSRTTSPARISPATGGTKATEPGMARLPCGSSSAMSGEASPMPVFP